MKQYIKNCHRCQRNKTARYRRNNILMLFEMSKQR